MDYLIPLKKEFENHSNPQKAIWMKNYMKGKFPFHGLDAKTRRGIQKDFFISYGYPKQEDLFAVIRHLWKLSEREYQHVAIDILQKFSKKLLKADIIQIENLIISKSWWDTVDGLAGWICGSYFKLYPEQIIPITDKWMKSENFWLQRTCLLFQLKYKANTDTLLFEQFIEQLYTEKEFFIRKAIGWVLREYSKTNPDWVRGYVSRQKLSGLSYREATKYLKS